MNEVLLKGTIVHKYETDRVVAIILGITEYNAKQNKHANYPKIYFFKSDNTGAENFLLHDRVVIHGHLSSSIRRNQTGSSYVSQSIVGDTIRGFGEPESKDGQEVVQMDYPENSVTLKGEVIHVEQLDHDFVLLKMTAPREGHNNHIRLTTKNKSYLLCSPGDEIQIQGKISTSISEKNGRKRYYENILPMQMIKFTSVTDNPTQNDTPSV